jgi:hypothetical protein
MSKVLRVGFVTEADAEHDVDGAHDTVYAAHVGSCNLVPRRC